MAYRPQTTRTDDQLKEPQSAQAEQAVLGSVLKTESALNQVLETIVSEDHFFSRKHRLIFRAILELYQRNEPVDITTVAERLSRNGDLETVGGRVYLVDLIESVPSTANVAAHAGILLEKSIYRTLISTSESIIADCYSQERDATDLLDFAESQIFEISQSRHRQGFVALRDLIPSTFEQIEEMQAQDSSLQGIPTGFSQLDVMINGLHSGELVIVAGRPSMGKSAIVMNMAEHMAVEHKKKVAVFSLEMSSEQLAIRMLCGRARVSQQKLRAGKLNDEEWQRLTRAGTLAQAEIYIDDSAALSSLEMKAKARRLKASVGLDVVMVDYIQMMQGTGRFENRNQEMSSVSRNLKALAKELHVPVVACSQLSRQVEQRSGEKRPQLSDLRESGAIEQDADVVMFVFRPELYYAHMEKTDPKFKEIEGKAELIVAKQRNGPTGLVHLAFLKQYSRFETVTMRPADLPPDAEPVDSGGPSPF
ncbi:MAG: replicative DNA helicase [bacterium]